MEHPFLCVLELHSTSFSMYCPTTGRIQEWGASVYICRCGVVEYRAIEYAFVTGELKSVSSDSWNWRKFVMVTFASKYIVLGEILYRVCRFMTNILKRGGTMTSPHTSANHSKVKYSKEIVVSIEDFSSISCAFFTGIYIFFEMKWRGRCPWCL